MSRQEYDPCSVQQLHVSGDADDNITVTPSRAEQDSVGESILAKEIGSGEANIQGKIEAFDELASLLNKFEFWFNIVTP